MVQSVWLLVADQDQAALMYMHTTLLYRLAATVTMECFMQVLGNPQGSCKVCVTAGAKGEPAHSC